MLVNVNNVKNTWVYRHFWTLISLSTILCNLFIFTSLNSLHLLSFQLVLPLPYLCFHILVCIHVCVCVCRGVSFFSVPCQVPTFCLCLFNNYFPNEYELRGASSCFTIYVSLTTSDSKHLFRVFFEDLHI